MRSGSLTSTVCLCMNLGSRDSRQAARPRAFHFPPSDRSWEDIPKPSTRCLSVFDAIGVDASKSDWIARGVASQDPDPILQLIDDHKQSIAAIDDLIDVASDLEETLPDDVQKSDFYGRVLTIVPSDDPRWIDITRRYYEENVKSDQIALQMLSAEPTTLAGAAALLKYAADHVAAGYIWPTDLSEVDDENPEEGSPAFFRLDWFYFLSRNLAAAIARLDA
jgi:hypothetical protein